MNPKTCFLVFSLHSKIKENKNASEIIKTVNMLVSSMNSEYLWEYMTRRFCASLGYEDDTGFLHGKF